MQRYLRAVVISAACLFAASGLACGSQGASVSQGANSCVMKSDGGKSRIHPENSGLSCSSIRSIISVLPSTPGVTPLTNENGEASWVCRVYPKSALPRELRCHEGKHHFERVRISG